MRIAHLTKPVFAAVLVLAALATANTVRAEDEFDVAVTAGNIVVTAKGKWHINKEYPWKLTVGETKLDNSKFKLSETSASVVAPKGEGKLRGGVCSGDQCKTFEKVVSIP